MRRLHPRGRVSWGVVVDADGAMLGPDCVLVRRTPGGFRCLAPGEARALQAAMLGPGPDPDWLFEPSRRIAQALAAGETALAQIYGAVHPARRPRWGRPGASAQRAAPASPRPHPTAPGSGRAAPANRETSTATTRAA